MDTLDLIIYKFIQLIANKFGLCNPMSIWWYAYNIQPLLWLVNEWSAYVTFKIKPIFKVGVDIIMEQVKRFINEQEFWFETDVSFEAPYMVFKVTVAFHMDKSMYSKFIQQWIKEHTENNTPPNKIYDLFYFTYTNPKHMNIANKSNYGVYPCYFDFKSEHILFYIPFNIVETVDKLVWDSDCYGYISQTRLSCSWNSILSEYWYDVYIDQEKFASVLDYIKDHIPKYYVISKNNGGMWCVYIKQKDQDETTEEIKSVKKSYKKTSTKKPYTKRSKK